MPAEARPAEIRVILLHFLLPSSSNSLGRKVVVCRKSPGCIYAAAGLTFAIKRRVRCLMHARRVLKRKCYIAPKEML